MTEARQADDDDDERPKFRFQFQGDEPMTRPVAEKTQRRRRGG